MALLSEQLKVDVPEGESGIWKVERFTVSDDDAKFGALRAAISGGGMGRFVPEGTYTALKRRGYTIMSDTPDEIRDHIGFVHKARGRVLIHGLGLGMCAAAALKKDEVTQVTIVEKSPDVIKLVGPWLTTLAEKLEKELILHEDDCFTWKPVKGAWWDVVWHDVWDDLCTDNLKEMTKLHRRFAKRCGWQGSWGRELLQYRRRRERVAGW